MSLCEVIMSTTNQTLLKSPVRSGAAPVKLVWKFTSVRGTWHIWFVHVCVYVCVGVKDVPAREIYVCDSNA